MLNLISRILVCNTDFELTQMRIRTTTSRVFLESLFALLFNHPAIKRALDLGGPREWTRIPFNRKQTPQSYGRMALNGDTTTTATRVLLPTRKKIKEKEPSWNKVFSFPFPFYKSHADMLFVRIQHLTHHFFFLFYPLQRFLQFRLFFVVFLFKNLLHVLLPFLFFSLFLKLYTRALQKNYTCTVCEEDWSEPRSGDTVFTSAVGPCLFRGRTRV